VNRFGRLSTIAVIALATTGCTGGDDEELAGGPFTSPSADPAATEAEQGMSAPADAQQVTIRDMAFSVDELTVPVGTTVTWLNDDDAGHTVTHGEDGAPQGEALFDEAVNAGQAVSYTFEEPGTYPVTCKIHKDMQMTITVEESGS
jgi:plastocyanin